MDNLAVAAAVGGVQLVGTTGELVKVRPGLLELGDPLRDFVQSLVYQLPDVLTRWLPTIPDAEDLTDLVQREPSRLRVPDEHQPLNRIRSVVTVTRRSPGRLRKEPFAFVEAQRFRGRPRATSQLTDKHGSSNSDVPAYWNLPGRPQWRNALLSAT
jgi:hypothetical protein